MTYKSSSAAETKKIAGEILDKFKNKERSGALVFALDGQLGSGKTQFAKGVAESLGIKKTITSPTFIIMQRYGNFYHFDLYRLHAPEEVLSLGWEEIISNSGNIVLVEWASRAKDVLPEDAIWVKIESTGETEREINIINV